MLQQLGHLLNMLTHHGRAAPKGEEKSSVLSSLLQGMEILFLVNVARRSTKWQRLPLCDGGDHWINGAGIKGEHLSLVSAIAVKLCLGASGQEEAARASRTELRAAPVDGDLAVCVALKCELPGKAAEGTKCRNRLLPCVTTRSISKGQG